MTEHTSCKIQGSTSHGQEDTAKQQSWNSSNEVRKRMNKESATNQFRAGGSNKKGMKNGPTVKPFCVRCFRDNHVLAACIAKRDNTGKLLDETMGTPESDVSSESNKSDKTPEPNQKTVEVQKKEKEPFVWKTVRALIREKRDLGTAPVDGTTLCYQVLTIIFWIPSLPFRLLWGVLKLLYFFFFVVESTPPSECIDYDEGRYLNFEMLDEYGRKMSNLQKCGFNYEYEVDIDANVFDFMRKQWGSFNPTKYSHHQLYTQFNLCEPVPYDKEEIVRNTVDYMIQQQEIRNIKSARRAFARVTDNLEERHFQQGGKEGASYKSAFIVASLTLLVALTIYHFVPYALTQALSNVEELLMSDVATSF